MVAVDVLKVPVSSRGNQYVLVVQDYFSKWPFACAMPDQKADRIVQVLRDDVFSLVGPPQKLHSDQGRNFESRILADLCAAFGVKKSRTTPYHPMGDGLVERMNRSLLTLLRSYTEREGDWEEHLQLLLYVYRSTKHATTGLSPYQVLFGVNPPSLHVPRLPGTAVPEPSEYSACLRTKILELREMVEANIVESAERLCHSYQGEGTCEKLQVGQRVLLDNPVKGKLDPRWTGPWTVVGLKKPSTVFLRVGTAVRGVHLNRIRPLLEGDIMDPVVPEDWTPPLFQEGGCPAPPGGENQDDSASTDASANSTLEEFASPTEQHPDVRDQTVEGLSSDGNTTAVTTRSGRVVKPVERFGWT